MTKPDNNGSRMMLTELIFSIFFFMVIVAVCIQLFAGAFITQKKSKELAIAVNTVACEADRFIATGDIPAEEFYDIDGAITDENSAVYSLASEKTSSESRTEKIIITYTKLEDEEIVYSLEVERGAL